MFGTAQHETSSMVEAASCGVSFLAKRSKKLVAIKGNTWSQNPQRVPVSSKPKTNSEGSDPFAPVQRSRLGNIAINFTSCNAILKSK